MFRIHLTVTDSTKLLRCGYSHFFYLFYGKAAHLDCVTADSQTDHVKEGKLHTYFEVVNYLLETYEAEDITAKNKAV